MIELLTIRIAHGILTDGAVLATQIGIKGVVDAFSIVQVVPQLEEKRSRIAHMEKELAAAALHEAGLQTIVKKADALAAANTMLESERAR